MRSFLYEFGTFVYILWIVLPRPFKVCVMRVISNVTNLRTYALCKVDSILSTKTLTVEPASSLVLPGIKSFAFMTIHVIPIFVTGQKYVRLGATLQLNCR